MPPPADSSPARPAGSRQRSKRGPSKGALARAELERRIVAEKNALRGIERRLRKLGPEGSPREIASVTRTREALRRRRVVHLLRLERLEARLTPQPGAPLARNAPGFRYGVRSVVSGGLPGLGKRS